MAAEDHLNVSPEEEAWRAMSLRSITLREGVLRMIFDPAGMEVTLPLPRGANLGEIMARLYATAESIRTQSGGMHGVVLSGSALRGLRAFLAGLHGVDLPASEIGPDLLRSIRALQAELHAAVHQGFKTPT